jgi:hypothetical protein
MLGPEGRHFSAGGASPHLYAHVLILLPSPLLGVRGLACVLIRISKTVGIRCIADIN